MLRPSVRPSLRPSVEALAALLIPALAGCNSKQPIDTRSLALVEIAALDDHDPEYAGHLERAIERGVKEDPGLRTIDGVRYDHPIYADCPADAPTPCGSSSCCPEGMTCSSGGTDGERYCANRASGRDREPCDAMAPGRPCEEGLTCHAISAHLGDSGPAICTAACRSSEDCAEGLCCVAGACHHDDGTCTPEMATGLRGD